MAARSPVRVVSSYPWLDIGDDMRITRWEATEQFEGACFVDRARPDHFSVVHRSTKVPGRWQVSRFDADGAVGDVETADLTLALREVLPRLYRLASVRTGAGVLGKAVL